MANECARRAGLDAGSPELTFQQAVAFGLLYRGANEDFDWPA